MALPIKVIFPCLAASFIGASAHAQDIVNCEVTYALKSGQKAKKTFSGEIRERDIPISEDFELMSIPARLHVTFVDKPYAPKKQFAINYTHLPSGTTLSSNSVSDDPEPSATLVAFDPAFIQSNMTRLIVYCSLKQGN